MTEAPEFYEITLRVKKRYAEEKDPGYELFMAVQDAIRWGNPAGQHLSDSATRTMVEAVMKTLGVDPWSRRMPKTPPTVDPMRAARQAVAELLAFTPEGGYIDGLAEAGFAHDNVGFFSTVEEYDNYLHGKDKDGNRTRRDDYPPLFADPVIYAVLAAGKHDGRTVKGLVRQLRESVGLEDEH